MFKIQNKAGPAQWFFPFGNSYFVHLNLSFDFAQDGEAVEPFRVSILEFRISPSLTSVLNVPILMTLHFANLECRIYETGH